MKRKTLTTAVLAGLTGMVGMVGVSNAVNLNPDGLGQVLLYPYYTARGGNDTLISVVNTTENAKSVKIRFLEGRNSREVLDFNIYMSAYDVWTGAITETADGGNAELVIRDRTCTVPYFVGAVNPGDAARVPFSNVEFIDFNGLSPQKVDGAGTELERTKSGYFEILEMGTLVDITEGSATAATHVSGGDPVDCAQLVTAWTRPQAGGTPTAANYWVIDETVDHEPPSGGLFGSASIINVGEGTLLSYNAEAMDNWSEAISHTDPGFVTPRVIDGTNNVSAVFISGAQQVDVRPWINNRDAVNAILMNNQIINEYVVTPNANGLTEWVLTHPTKRFHVDPLILGAAPAIQPFSVKFNSQATRPGTSCEPITFRLWDREEVELADDPIGVIPPRPSPLPPEQPDDPETFDLCYEANVVRFLRVDAMGDSPVITDDNTNVTELSPTNTEILGENRYTTLFMPSNFISGWSQFNFDPESIDPALLFPADARRISSLDGVDYVGLPTIGFQASTLSNNTLVVDGENVLSNYGGTFKHRGSRRIEATPTSIIPITGN